MIVGEGKNPHAASWEQTLSVQRTELECIGELARILSELEDCSSLPPRDVLAELFDPIHAPDLADLISEAPADAVLPLFEAIRDDERAAAVLPLLDEDVREKLLAQLSLERKAALLTELPADDAADVLAEMPEPEQREVLAELPAEEARDLRALAQYPPDSAGGLMNNQFLAMREDQTVRAALMQVRTAEHWEDMTEVFVVTEGGRLTGRISLDALLRAPPMEPLRNVMETSPVFVRVDESGEQAAQRATHYRLSLLPVVDASDSLVGVVAYDDVMDTLHEEASEDMYRLAGTLEQNPQRESTLQRLLSRFPFLLVTLLGTYAVSVIAEMFLGTLDAFDILRFVPMIAALAGNAGIQSSTTMIRGFATGDIGEHQFLEMFRREVWLGVLSGAAAGLVGLLLLVVGHAGRHLWAIVPTAQMISVVLATAMGTAIPFFCWRFRLSIGKRELRLDPALAAGPFITTLNDVLSTTIALILSTSFLA